MSDFMLNMRITAPHQRASTLSATLSPEAYAAVFAMNLTQAERTDGDLYVAALRRKFADRKTPEAYMADFRACKQDAKDDAGAYLDKLVDLARKAYAHIFKDGIDEAAQLAFVRPQFIEGLRRNKVREWVAVDKSATTLDALRTLALDHEHTSNVLDPPKPTNEQAKSNAARANDDDDSSNKANGRKRNDKAHNKQGAKSNQSSATCQHCKNVGHTIKECRKLQAALGQQVDKPQKGAKAAPPQVAPNKGSTTTCYRCGKVGHKSTDCFSARNAAGEWLQDNGRRAPQRANSMVALVPDAAADEPKPAPAKPAPQAGSHLNAARDVHQAVARPAAKNW
jgi:hypothetical protein